MGSGLPFSPNVTYAPSMARPLRIEFPGAVYHVTSRGDRREPIVLGDEDREDQQALPVPRGSSFRRGDAAVTGRTSVPEPGERRRMHASHPLHFARR